jgi:hypothetical protein
MDFECVACLDDLAQLLGVPPQRVDDPGRTRQLDEDTPSL